MNVLWLKYASAVAEYGSISAAAKKLYMGQPNLSRAIRELEESLGISIFERTAKGINLTAQGEEFIRYANSILRQLDEVENLYKNGGGGILRFSVSVPRASYISAAFASFSRKIPHDKPEEIVYKETNSLRAVNNILHADYRLGIIRYAVSFDRYFTDMLEQNGLHYEQVAQFRYKVIINADNPLAGKAELNFTDLKGQIEIAHADPYVPSLPLSVVKKQELPQDVEKRVFVFERASQFELLAANADMYMLVSSVPQETLNRYGLVEKVCSDNDRTYKDVLIYKKNYRLSEYDKIFKEELLLAAQSVQ